MDILQSLQGIIRNGLPQTSAQDSGAAQGFSKIFGNSGLLGPTALGGVVGALLGGSLKSIAGGALLAGGGSALWKKYKDRISEVWQNQGNPAREAGSPLERDALPSYAGESTAQYAPAASADSERAARLVRALVYAAKSDGHIDADEQKAIQDQLRQLNLGPDGEKLVLQAMNEPLDPARIANGVSSEEEALEIFTLSCAVIKLDHFMERSYLDALARALKIPDDVKADLENKLHPELDGQNRNS